MNTSQNQDFTKDFAVHFNQNIAWSMNKFHFHDTYEILLALSDGGEYFVGDACYPIVRGSLLVFNNMDLHRSASCTTNYERYVVHFFPEYAAMLSTPQTNLLQCFEHHVGVYNGQLQLNDTQFEQVLAHFKELEASGNSSGYGCDLKRRQAFTNMLLYLNSLYGHSQPHEPSTRKDGFHKVQPILIYVQHNFQKPITLDSISQQFFMSKYYLCHVFKDVTGFGLNEYIVNLRISKARELLRQEISVQAVGEAVGFANNSHFIRTFKAMVGVAPGQYSHRYK